MTYNPMATGLPKKLNKEPLIDAVFEVRFASTIPASVILPGVLYNRLSGNKNIEALPISQLPKPIRDADPNLKFAPLSRVDWGQFFINIGDFSVSISSKYPYAGWANFRPAIIDVMGILFDSNVVQTLERYSIKYVDMIPSSDDQQKVSMINCNVTLADHKLVKEPFQLRIEIPRDGFINAVNIASSAQAVLHDGTKREGLIVDVDTFAIQDNISMQMLLDGFTAKLESIHQTNKAMFFDCLTDETMKSLEPVYE